MKNSKQLKQDLLSCYDNTDAMIEIFEEYYNKHTPIIYVYVVMYQKKTIVFKRYQNAINFINSKRKGTLIYTDEVFNGKNYTYLPIKTKLR